MNGIKAALTMETLAIATNLKPEDKDHWNTLGALMMLTHAQLDRFMKLGQKEQRNLTGYVITMQYLMTLFRQAQLIQNMSELTIEVRVRKAIATLIDFKTKKNDKIKQLFARLPTSVSLSNGDEIYELAKETLPRGSTVSDYEQEWEKLNLAPSSITGINESDLRKWNPLQLQ